MLFFVATAGRSSYEKNMANVMKVKKEWIYVSANSWIVGVEKNTSTELLLKVQRKRQLSIIRKIKTGFQKPKLVNRVDNRL